jgi:hypothetical protein
LPDIRNASEAFELEAHCTVEGYDRPNRNRVAPEAVLESARIQAVEPQRSAHALDAIFTGSIREITRAVWDELEQDDLDESDRQH